MSVQRSNEPAPEPLPDWSTYRLFRKVPVSIEAVQFGFAEYADEPAFRDSPAWLEEALAAVAVTYVFSSEDYWYFQVETLEGDARGGPDDWLIRGVEGELYPCKDRIFRKTYEPVA